MKKAFTVFLVLLLIIVPVGCEQNNAEDAAWANYPDISFKQYLANGIKGFYADDLYNFTDDIRISTEQGWNMSGSLLGSRVSDGNTAYTYIVDVYFDGELGCSFYFFMEYDKSTKQLKTKGAMSTEYFGTESDWNEITASEAIKVLEQMKQYQ